MRGFFIFLVLIAAICAVSCAKTAEPITMQLGIQSRVGPGSCISLGCGCPYGKGYFWKSGLKPGPAGETRLGWATPSLCERIVKIGQHLAKLRARFLRPPIITDAVWRQRLDLRVITSLNRSVTIITRPDL